ncbi:PRC-barrel domain-containing protein [Actinoplanes sp. NPDC024001]|uniref:PRC-barrel domain-containing protein n=1 Tax=Actinoplanes sp. NPDC024001 TaxID=3154598 RepID=UPI003404A87B
MKGESDMAADKNTATLIKLSDSEHMLADPDADIRGRKVVDRDGEDLGKVDDLLIDATERKVRMLRIEHGGILGIGATPSFVPVDAVTAVDDDVVHVGEARERVTGSPRYDPDLVNTGELYEQLYRHYGYTPLWPADNVAPEDPTGRR